MGLSLRFGVLACLLPTVVLLGCGGKVGGEEVTDTGADTAVDTGLIDPDGGEPDADPRPDIGPGGCGFGACNVGEGCSDGCNTCECVSTNSWKCRYDCPPDVGPPPPPPCPYPKPADRTYCLSEGQTCDYKNSCGTIDYATCVLGPEGRVWMTKSDCTSPTPCPYSLPPKGLPCNGYNKCSYKNTCGGVDTAACNGKYWDVYPGPCTSPTCPSYLPPSGASCAGPLKCSYPNGCGSYHSATCDGTSSYWRVFYSDCPPPPPPPLCPSTTPSDGSYCASGLSCTWSNGCGGLNYGYCSGGGWSIKREPCSSICPPTKPPSGTACKTPGTTACRYPVSSGSTCITQCFCADDYRWACITPPCSEPTPSFDAGTP